MLLNIQKKKKHYTPNVSTGKLTLIEQNFVNGGETSAVKVELGGMETLHESMVKAKEKSERIAAQKLKVEQSLTKSVISLTGKKTNFVDTKRKEKRKESVFALLSAAGPQQNENNKSPIMSPSPSGNKLRPLSPSASGNVKHLNLQGSAQIALGTPVVPCIEDLHINVFQFSICLSKLCI